MIVAKKSKICLEVLSPPDKNVKIFEMSKNKPDVKPVKKTNKITTGWPDEG